MNEAPHQAAPTGAAAEITALLAEAVALGVAPRLDAAWWRDGEIGSASSHTGAPALFDLASLTKPLATGLCALGLIAEGTITLDAPLAHGESVRQLLNHSAGYASWRPVFQAALADAEARQIFEAPPSPYGRATAFARSAQLTWAAVEAERPRHSPGAHGAYSDLGMLVLQRHLEQASGLRLAELFRTRVAEPLGLSLGFVDLRSSAPRPRALPTGTERPRPLAPGQETALAGGLARATIGEQPGEVDDDNAYALGGVAGHAGLFGTAAAVALAGGRFLEELAGAGRLAPARLARHFCEPSGPPAANRALGWDRAAAVGSSLGTRLGRGPRGAIGHLGFTGVSLWLDLDRQVALALCSNRVWFGRDNQLLRDFRPRFHDAVARAFDLA